MPKSRCGQVGGERVVLTPADLDEEPTAGTQEAARSEDHATGHVEPVGAAVQGSEGLETLDVGR